MVMMDFGKVICNEGVAAMKVPLMMQSGKSFEKLVGWDKT